MPWSCRPRNPPVGWTRFSPTILYDSGCPDRSPVRVAVIVDRGAPRLPLHRAHRPAARRRDCRTPRVEGASMVAARTSVFTESVIREMSRLAALNGAVNLAQGYPDFPAPRE